MRNRLYLVTLTNGCEVEEYGNSVQDVKDFMALAYPQESIAGVRALA